MVTAEQRFGRRTPDCQGERPKDDCRCGFALRLQVRNFKKKFSIKDE